MARWQFGITTVYHFLFVPLSISLSAVTAGLQTAWLRTGKDAYLHATKFWGKLFLINIAMGIVTGIVQEFQFGMNWSSYSRFVGDIFGAPLAMEAIAAFFLESTFIGLWIFGWDKLPRALHCACIWLVAVGTLMSAWFILAANSWMQHPVGYRVNPDTGRAELTSIWRVLTQNTTLVQVFHTASAAYLTGAAFVIGIASLHLWRTKRRQAAGTEPDAKTRAQTAVMRSSLRLGLVLAVVAGLGTAVSGDTLGKVMFDQQPMKMAAAEALWDTEESAPFSVFAIGDVNEGHNTVELSIPGLLSFLAHDNFTDPVPGINDVARDEAARYGGAPDDYIPSIFTTFWGFRLMIGFGMTSFVVGLVGLWTTRRRRWLAAESRTAADEVPRLMLTRGREMGPWLTKWSWRIGIFTLGFPLLANSFGWIFTEMGRQPWVVFGLMSTANGVSPIVADGEVLASMIVFTALYGALAVVEVALLVRYAGAGPDVAPSADGTGPAAPSDTDRQMAFAY
ncbi:MAG: cytochrome ubiquinol oxidase subunit I [Streptomycetaceae bacterium]|nr:cytochrome ubiquinol oxidase subunit I [Streptomycetaceae bacterium]